MTYKDSNEIISNTWVRSWGEKIPCVHCITSKQNNKTNTMLPHANLLLLKTVIKNLKPNSLETDALSDRQGIRCPFRKCIIDYYEPKIAVAFDRSKRKKENEICRRLGDYYDFCKRINLDFLYVVTGLENMADILLYSDFIQHEIEVTLPTELKMSDCFYTYFHKNFQSYITILSFDAYKYIKNY